MKRIRAIRYFLPLALTMVGSAAMADVNDTSTERRLSLPGGARAIVMPREDWTLTKEQRRPGDTAVYYALSSEQRQMVFSVYIDKTNVCSSADSCLANSLANPQYKDAKELQKTDLAQFKVAQFFLDNPRGTPVKQANLIVAAYVDGQWFDVHVSKVGAERPDMATLLEFLRAITLK